MKMTLLRLFGNLAFVAVEQVLVCALLYGFGVGGHASNDFPSSPKTRTTTVNGHSSSPPNDSECVAMVKATRATHLPKAY